MVKTRRSSPFLQTLRSGRGRGKNIGNVPQEQDPSSDESGLHVNSVSAKKRRLQGGEGREGHDFYPELQATVPLTRTTRGSQRVVSNGTMVETRKSRGRGRKGEPSVPINQKTKKKSDGMFVDASERVRRSLRSQRKVYETLNVQMLTDHRYLTGYEHSKPPKKREGKKRRFLEEQSDSQTEGDEDNLTRTASMYDLVKRKHDQTPTPEKASDRKGKSGEDQAEDSDDDDSDDDDEEEEDEDEDEDEDGDGEEEEEEEEEEGKDCKGYQLRKKRPIPNRYTAPPLKSKKGRKSFHIALRQTRKERKKQMPYASPIRRVRRHKQKAINMSSSTSSDDSDNEKDERKFEHRKSKSMAKARGRCLPMNFTMDDAATGILKERARIGSSLADVDPMNIDNKVMFDAVGGLNKQIRALKEMVLFPLMYPEVFEKFKISPPRGVLFHGPPGTGKTLVARALANECSQGGKKVAFFMRKGADCLSKWVGESERQLRLLFDQAFSMRPAIIFFDEIDGLAPVRSSRQDQIHSSIVSTLLALMDGLDSRGEIVVIGATNRIDAIDPALRRPGRFDREFQFALPDRNARRSILTIHTHEWEPKLLPSFVSEVADHCVGYCGADIKALCTEAALFALRRRYPQIYNSDKKLLLDVNSIEVTAKDFQKAMKTIIPASQRSVVSPARALSTLIFPLLKAAFNQAVEVLEKLFPPAHTQTVAESTPCSLMGNPSCSHQDQRTRAAAVLSEDDASSDEDLGPSIFEPLPGTSRSERYMRRVQQDSNNPETDHPSSFFSTSHGHGKGPLTYRPRLLISGNQGMGQSTHIAPALLHTMEHMTAYCLDLPALYGVTSKTPEEACSQLFREARRTSPCVVYAPHLDALWNATGDSLHATLLSLLHDLPPLAPVLFLATADERWGDLPSIMQQLFTREIGQVFQVATPTPEERRAFFNRLFMEAAIQPPKLRKSRKDHMPEVLPFAPTPPPRQLSEPELKKARHDEENTMRELRIFLRDVHMKLITDRRFKEFEKPVDLEEVPDYLEVIEEPMDLSTVIHRIDCHHYSTCTQYLIDVDLITSNALKYNPDLDPLDKIIRHRACVLSDMAHSLIKSQLEPEFEKACEEIVESRRRRGDKPNAVAPPYVFTAAKQVIADDRVDKPRQDQDKTVLGVSDITFVSESQPQSNSTTHTTTKPRRRKAPIYWGKKPKKKKDVKRKLNSEMDIVSQNKDESRNDDKDIEDKDVEDKDVEDKDVEDKDVEDSDDEEVNANDKTAAEISEVAVDTSCDVVARDEEEEVAVIENGDVPLNGDVTMLNSEKLPSELSRCEFISKTVDPIEGEDSASLSEIQSNRGLFEAESSLPNGIPADVDGEENEGEENDDEAANELPEKEPRAAHGTRNSEQLAADMKEQLEPVLDLLVDSTECVTVEMLERYYSALQCCIHQHRYSEDKTRLVEDLELMIHGFRTTRQTSRIS